MVSGPKPSAPRSRKAIALVCLVVALASLNAHAGNPKILKKPAASSAPCRSVSEFMVRDLSFDKMDTDAALRRLLEGSPFQASYSDKTSSRQITAEHVSGDLATVLTEFADEVGLSWVQKNCQILVSQKTIVPQEALPSQPLAVVAPASTEPEAAKPPVAHDMNPLPKATNTPFTAKEPTPTIPVPQKWTVRQGQRFSDAMSDWCKKAGCLGVFWETGELESELPQSFEGSFEDAVTKAIETLAGQGIPIRAVFYSGNGVVRIMGKK